MVVLADCFRAHEDAGGFFAKDDERPFADPLFTPPSSPSYQQHPTPSSTAVDSPPNVVSLSTPASEQSTPTYTGMHLPLDADEVKTSDASKHDGEVKGLNPDEDEDADAEGEDDDGEWVPATQGNQLPSSTPQDDILQPTLPPSSSSTTAESALIATLSETSSTQPVIDDASNDYQHYPSAEYTAYADCVDLSVNATSAENDDPKRAIQPAVAGHGVADVADATMDALNTAYVLNAGTHGEGWNAGNVAPFNNSDIFSSNLPANQNVWAATQPERHTDVSPAFSTSHRSPYSFTEEGLPFGAYDASSTLPFLGAQRGSGQTIFGSQYESHKQLWDDTHAHQVFLSSGMQTTHGELDRATSAGLFLPTNPVHHRSAPLGPSSYIAPLFVHARSAAPACYAIQSSRDAQTDPIAIPWSSSSQFPAPLQSTKGKGKALASNTEQGPSDHPRPVAKLPSRPRNRTQTSSCRTQAAAAIAMPLEYPRHGVHHGQTQTSASPSRLPAHSSNTHASIAIASTSRSATAPTPHDPSSFASTSQPARSFAPSTTPAPPTQQDYMSKFRVDLDERLPAPCFMHPETGKLQILVSKCGWVGPNGEVCRHDYQQNVWRNGDMRRTVYKHLLVHKRTPLANVYHPEENLRLGPHGKSGSKKAAGSKEALNTDRARCEKGEKDKGDERSQQELNSSQARGKKLKCCLRDPKTGIFCGKEFTYGEISGHVCRIHYDMPEWRKRGCSSDADAEGRPTKKART